MSHWESSGFRGTICQGRCGHAFFWIDPQKNIPPYPWSEGIKSLQASGAIVQQIECFPCTAANLPSPSSIPHIVSKPNRSDLCGPITKSKRGGREGEKEEGNPKTTINAPLSWEKKASCTAPVPLVMTSAPTEQVVASACQRSPCVSSSFPPSQMSFDRCGPGVTG